MNIRILFWAPGQLLMDIIPNGASSNQKDQVVWFCLDKRIIHGNGKRGKKSMIKRKIQNVLKYSVSECIHPHFKCYQHHCESEQLVHILHASSQYCISVIFMIALLQSQFKAYRWDDELMSHSQPGCNINILHVPEKTGSDKWSALQ